jgi:signal transduction histidine kinase
MSLALRFFQLFMQSEGPPTSSQPQIITVGILLSAGLLVGVFLGYGVVGALRIRKLEKDQRNEREQARQAESERLRGTYELIANMTSSLIYSRVLDAALDTGTNALLEAGSNAEMMVSAVFLFFQDGTRTMLRVGSSRRMTQADQRTILPASDGALARAINTAESILCQDIASDSELGYLVSLRACHSAYCLPLRIGLDVYGAMLFAHPDASFFVPTRRDILDIVAHQATIAIQNARLYSDLEEEKERMVQIQEEARRKLARDLHDGPTQSVAAIAMRVNFARRMLEKNLPGVNAELGKIEELARRTTKEIRHMLFTLRPLVLESEGLEAALKAMADKLYETYEQKVIVEVDTPVLLDLEVGKQTVIFYIAEEAANNARKHAQAAHIWVRLRRLTNDVAMLEVKDDGIGFNIGSVDANYDTRGSLGMVNMRERAELLNGVLKIISAEGKGTMIQLLVPLTEEAEERLRQGT